MLITYHRHCAVIFTVNTFLTKVEYKIDLESLFLFFKKMKKNNFIFICEGNFYTKLIFVGGIQFQAEIILKPTWPVLAMSHLFGPLDI